MTLFPIIFKQDMFLQKKEYDWTNCPFEISSVESIHCAFDETFVIFTKDGYLRHVNQYGNAIIRTEKLKGNSSITMISDHQVVIGRKEGNFEIWLVDLKDSDRDRNIIFSEEENLICKHDPKPLTCEEQDCYSFFFEKTKLYCFAYQEKKVCDYSTHLYIQAIYLPISSIYKQTTENKKVQKLEYKYDDIYVVKVDNSSSISIMHESQEKLKFEVISQEEIQKFSCKTEIETLRPFLWRKSEDEFIVLTLYSEEGFLIANTNSSTLEKKHNVVKQVCNQKVIFLNELFTIEVEYEDSHYQWEVFNYDMNELQSFRVDIKKSKQLQALPYDGTKMTSWRRNGKTALHVEHIELIYKKEAYMHMLLHENEDFDDDFLLDTLDVLGLM